MNFWYIFYSLCVGNFMNWHYNKQLFGTMKKGLVLSVWFITVCKLSSTVDMNNCE